MAQHHQCSQLQQQQQPSLALMSEWCRQPPAPWRWIRHSLPINIGAASLPCRACSAQWLSYSLLQMGSYTCLLFKCSSTIVNSFFYIIFNVEFQNQQCSLSYILLGLVHSYNKDFAIWISKGWLMDLQIMRSLQIAITKLSYQWDSQPSACDFISLLPFATSGHHIWDRLHNRRWLWTVKMKQV